MSYQAVFLLVVLTAVPCSPSARGWLHPSTDGCGAAPLAAPANIKLYMKDGSFQLVSSYEVRGDRVRYYSLERSEWEEVPKELVDLEATQRAVEEEKTAHQKELQEAKQLDEEKYEKPVNQGYEVAPGVRLPQEEGIYTYDGLRVIHLFQSSAETVTDKRRAALMLALPGPLLKSRTLVVLPGPKAALRFSQPQPVFYVQSAEGLGAKLELIQVKPGKEARLVEKVEARGGSGKSAELREAVPLERTQVTPGLYRLKPTRALEPGEYALGELVQEKLNLDLWDFGIGETPAKVM
jgi:hypothetical protein